MLLDREVGPYLVLDDESIETALRRISGNHSRIVFVVDSEGVLVGSLNDGDFRRWVVDTQNPSMQEPCRKVANRTCVAVGPDYVAREVDELFVPGIEVIPVLDDRRRVVGIAKPRTKDFFLDGRHLRADQPTFVIAEIGNNHNGNLETAYRLVDAAAEAGVDCAKFQMRDMSALYRSGQAGFAGEDLGAQYTLELLREVSLTNDEMFKALDYVRHVGLVPLCTPWDEPSARLLGEYGLPGFKIASADLTNHDLLSLLGGFGRPLIVSTGMSTEDEIVESAMLLRSLPSSFAMLHANSSYPSPFKDVNLLYMDRLAELGECLVGYSGHERGYAIPLAAVARGAKIIEKHITLDRTARGNDHKVSLEPDEFSAMVAGIRDVETALGSAQSRNMSQGELLNRLALAKSLVAARDLPVGHVLTVSDLEVRSPGRGLQPNAKPRVVGKRISRSIPAGDFLFEADVSETKGPRPFHFKQPWGLPVRFHDYADLLPKSNPDFLEFHLSYRDMDIAPDLAVPEILDLDFTVHSPDLFANDHLLDLASDDDLVRERSVEDLQRVIDLTRALKPKFLRATSPVVIVSVGGSSVHVPLPERDKSRLYERCAEALTRVDAEGVELTAQTLPPFPWHVGGQRYWNLFVEPEEIAEFHRVTGIRITLDTSHTKLATNNSGGSFHEAMEMLLPISAHLHLADATGVDGEGVQVGEGEIDWALLSEQISRLAPRASFIPEIWQGHVAGGQGFWVGLERLERYLDAR